MIYVDEAPHNSYVRFLSNGLTVRDPIAKPRVDTTV